MSDTIAAIATARTPAAIGIVRISGADTPAVVDLVFADRSGKCAAQLPLRRLVYGHMRTAEGKVIDDGLCVLFAPESSYTGEWSAELHCHGAPVVLDEVLRCAVAGGARLAKGGGFGQLLRLCDTAGIRDTADSGEKIGVDRAVAAAEQAELALVVLDGSAPLTGEEERIFALAEKAEHAVLVVNKIDLPQRAEPGVLEARFPHVVHVCAATGEGVEQIGEAVRMFYPEEAGAGGVLLTNSRQAEAVTRALRAVERAQAAVASELTPDAVLTDAEEALAALGELTGKSIREDLVATIFSRFCVGK